MLAVGSSDEDEAGPRNCRFENQPRKLYVFEKPVPEEEPPSSTPKAERDAYKKHVDDANETTCLMLATMNSELQKQHENMAAFNMIEHLKMLYQEQARHERFEVSKAFFKES
ncbi:hypothetical protein KIW84_032411 [Lathyrus oleraceus]|uniref:Uncharacterized protein n=1 Tax=Pisum sativum TaxID=3888 RepID=A0A9D4XXF1_PEA|nr:hypothetical protein KIW84_032411 [Pisum sativum]